MLPNSILPAISGKPSSSSQFRTSLCLYTHPLPLRNRSDILIDYCSGCLYCAIRNVWERESVNVLTVNLEVGISKDILEQNSPHKSGHNSYCCTQLEQAESLQEHPH